MIATLQSYGIVVPDDVSLICFDDVEWFSFTVPKITAISSSQSRLAEAAVTLLLTRIEEPEQRGRAPSLMEIKSELMLRGSTASPRQGELVLRGWNGRRATAAAVTMRPRRHGCTQSVFTLRTADVRVIRTSAASHPIRSLIMLDANPIRRLKDTHPGLEVWWDSSPLVYADWLAGAGRDHRDARLFDLVPGPDGQTLFAPDSLLDGATTNQPLTWQVLEKYPEVWSEWLRAEEYPVAGAPDAREAMWRVHIEVAARGADMLAPIFEATDRRRGQICCQVDPRDMTDLPAMLAQARRIHAARPNIMVKLPGTAEGIECVRLLTAEGVPTNVTLGFTVSATRGDR